MILEMLQDIIQAMRQIVIVILIQASTIQTQGTTHPMQTQRIQTQLQYNTIQYNTIIIILLLLLLFTNLFIFLYN